MDIEIQKSGQRFELKCGFRNLTDGVIYIMSTQMKSLMENKYNKSRRPRVEVLSWPTHKESWCGKKDVRRGPKEGRRYFMNHRSQ